MATAFGGLAQVNRGQSLSILGGDIAAQSYRQAGVASLAAANYNNAVSRLNFNRKMDVMSREIEQFMEQQQVSKATTGFSLGSASFNDITHNTLNIFERAVIQTINSQQQAEKATLFEGQAAQVEFENRARAAEYQGQAAASSAGSGAGAAIGGIFGKVFSSVSRGFSGGGFGF